MLNSLLANAQLALGLLLIAGTVYAVFRGVDVRLALGMSGLLLGTVGGDPLKIVRAFMTSFVDPKVVLPICFAMGFAFVLKETACDRHLVHLLVGPLRRVRLLLVPGTVLVGFLVNIPVVSQTGTAASVGPVMIPLLAAMRFTPAAAGTALLLGTSIGGEMMNPGGTQYGAIVQGIEDAGGRDVSYVECVAATRDLNLASLTVSTLLLCALTFWEERREATLRVEPLAPSDPPLEPLRINYVKACVPIVPLLLLFLVSPPAPVFPLPADWLVESSEDAGLFSSRLVGAAMLVGFAVAMITSLVFGEGWDVLSRGMKSYFEGMGYGFREIITLIASAACFAQGVLLAGIGDMIQTVLTEAPSLLIPAAGGLTFSLAFLCGSGIAASKGLFAVFAQSAIAHGVDPLDVGAIMAVCADAGRTMSPVAAVTLMCARLTGTRPVELFKRIAIPVAVGTAVAVAMSALLR